VAEESQPRERAKTRQTAANSQKPEKLLNMPYNSMTYSFAGALLLGAIPVLFAIAEILRNSRIFLTKFNFDDG
jgi:ABC-type Fe3+ transport system permease subunit